MTALTIAKPQDIDRVMRLVSDFHARANIVQSDEERRAALLPLLDGSPHGVIYLAGPGRAPIGYVVVTFGWSVELGGMEAWIDEIYIRPAVRGRGIGSEILSSLPRALAGAGVKALHLEVAKDNEQAKALYEKLHFSPRDNFSVMTRKL